ncbi:MAG TPA: hypothetical protein VK694_02435 [Verrucomicrobiae bacterium]|nr:hypothetical protein [Verrucomicrobiae bacterium]
MTYRIIKVGSSAGVIIPKKQLEELGLRIGDDAQIDVKKPKQNKHEKFMNDLEKFMDTYDQDLKNLAQR